VIDDKGRLTQNGFLGILGYIAGQPQIVEAYPKLKKMYSFKPDGTIQLVPGPNMIIYSIASDSSRKQVILFEIYSKVEVNQMDPSMPLIPDKHLIC